SAGGDQGVFEAGGGVLGALDHHAPLAEGFDRDPHLAGKLDEASLRLEHLVGEVAVIRDREVPSAGRLPGQVHCLTPLLLRRGRQKGAALSSGALDSNLGFPSLRPYLWITMLPPPRAVVGSSLFGAPSWLS